MLGSGIALVATRGALDGADAGSQGGKDRVEVLDDARLAADHKAVAAVEAPDAAAGAGIDIVDARRGEPLGAIDVITIIGIAAIDDDVAALEERLELGQRPIDHRGGHHEPDGARRGELLHEVL